MGKIGSSDIAYHYIGNTLCPKVYRGSNLIFEASTTTTTFDYFYETIDLLHIPHVKNDIYGLHYDLIGTTDTTDETTSSAYTFEKDNIYSWFN